MRNYLLLILMVIAVPAQAAEWGLTGALVAGGPSLEAGGAVLHPLGKRALAADVTLGVARGYRTVAASAAWQNKPEPGWFYAWGLRNEWVFDHGAVEPRLGLTGEFGWQGEAPNRIRVGFKPMLFILGIGPAVSLNVSVFPW